MQHSLVSKKITYTLYLTNPGATYDIAEYENEDIDDLIDFL